MTRDLNGNLQKRKYRQSPSGREEALVVLVCKTVEVGGEVKRKATELLNRGRKIASCCPVL